MADQATFQGALQAAIMRALWETGGGTVQAVRDALSPDGEQAYTTIQTVLNRLAERGLVERERQGVAIVYRPALAEGEYLSRSIVRLLDDATPDARKVALAQLIGTLGDGERDGLAQLAAEVEDRRRGRT